MDTNLVIGALISAITGLSGFCAFLIRYVLSDKDRQIERWQKVAEGNGLVANETLALAKEEKEILLEVIRELREMRKRERRTGG